MTFEGNSETSLGNFEARLQQLMVEHQISLPFVCENSPLGCEAFLVGFLPVQRDSHSFWDYWVTEEGFSREKWLQTYLEGKQGGNAVREGASARGSGNTRQVIDWVTKAAAPVKILETNYRLFPISAEKQVATRASTTAIFHFLVNAIRPKVIVINTREARSTNLFAYLDWLNPYIQVISTGHFSRGYSHEKAKRLAAAIRHSIAQERPPWEEYWDAGSELPV